VLHSSNLVYLIVAINPPECRTCTPLASGREFNFEKASLKMENYHIEHDLKLFGLHVKTFPLGIGETFDELINNLPEGPGRSYFGISYVKGDKIVYLAMTAERFEGESNQYGYEKFIVARGNYKSIVVKDWSKKTDRIKELFHEILNDECPVATRPCVEWYKDDVEMMCMVRTEDSSS
jgi:hypothetical protein